MDSGYEMQFSLSSRGIERTSIMPRQVLLTHVSVAIKTRILAHFKEMKNCQA